MLGLRFDFDRGGSDGVRTNSKRHDAQTASTHGHAGVHAVHARADNTEEALDKVGDALTEMGCRAQSAGPRVPIGGWLVQAPLCLPLGGLVALKHEAPQSEA